MPIKLFCCYAREDEALLLKLKNHLLPLQRQRLIEFWHDREILPGQEWQEQITRKLNDADLILLLVSPDFMASDYCYGIEMQRALERHVRGECVVIPVILRPVYWHGEPLGSLQALPTDGKPITGPDWHTLDSAFYDVVSEIHRVIQHLPSSVVLRNLTFLRTLGGHQSTVYSVALSADGTTLVSGSSDRTIKVWGLASGRELRSLTGHQDGVNSVALSADGTTLVSGSSDRTIKVWDLASGRELRSLTGHQDGVNSVALSADGTTLVSGSSDRTIKVWDLASGRELRSLTGHQDGVNSVALSADGTTLVSGSTDCTIKVWDLSSGRELRTLTGHRGSVACVALSGDGKTLVSGSEDPTCNVWKA